MLNLYLLRHGKTAKREGYLNDFDRPLNKKGITQINQVGIWLKQEGHKIDQILSSLAIRVEQTATIFNHFLGGLDVTFDKELYLAGYDFILDFISKNGQGSKLLYVGHNFGISDLASYLTNNTYTLSPGMLVVLSFELRDWKMIAKGSGSVIRLYVPTIDER